MTVRNGRQFLSIPGPTTVPDEVLAAMHRPAVDIYTGPLVGITDSSLADLRRLFRTKGQPYIYIGNGHGAWEGALANVLSAGDTVLVLESGRFAAGWGQMAEAMGARVETVTGDQRRAVDPALLEAHLRADLLRKDKADRIKAILVVQVDTASGVVNDIPALRRAIDATGHDALFMVDAIASLGTMEFEMDKWGVDVAVTCSQKGLMMPPGISFAAAGPKAMAAHGEAGFRTRYWDWTERHGEEHYMKYCGTPPVQMLYGLRQSLDMLLAEGLENVFERHRLLAGAVHAAVAVWAEGGVLEFNITEPAERAPSVTTILTNGRDPAPLLDYCREKCGVVLGIAIGDLNGKGFRIGHMGHVNAPMLLGTLGVTETALAALDIPHGRGGVQAAIDYLAGAVKP
ncbi:MAG: aminotransferase class V-fold PLP-dependent enzyme [Alphaproteobacteria bacterium]|nr:aminotransferase class V-fold PLP-dependent enzyme [Alphaproteobacteria bacterium]